MPGHNHCCVFGCTNRRNNICWPLIASCWHFAENSKPRAQRKVSTGDDVGVYVDPHDEGRYIVLNNTSVNLTCFATGNGNFSYTWSVLDSNGLKRLLDTADSSYLTPPLRKDETYECLVENPLLKSEEHVVRVQFVLGVEGTLVMVWSAAFCTPMKNIL